MNNFVKRGIPFMVLIVGAPFMMKQFSSIRYEYKRSNMMVRSEQLRVEEVSEARKAGVSTDEKTNIILEKARQTAKGEWKNIRGPRPWEDSREIQAQQKDDS